MEQRITLGSVHRSDATHGNWQKDKEYEEGITYSAMRLGNDAHANLEEIEADA